MTRELWKGNEAIAEAAVRAGLDAYFGYPITPQTEILEYLSRCMPELGRAFVQAESELGAINMVYGAACAGVRVMSTSSSPGVSLMMEGLSYIAGTEVPAVLVNVMRGGPGLGNIAPTQADYNQAVRGGGHTTCSPPSSKFLASIVPPWASTSCLAMASPNPVPQETGLFEFKQQSVLLECYNHR